MIGLKTPCVFAKNPPCQPPHHGHRTCVYVRGRCAFRDFTLSLSKFIAIGACLALCLPRAARAGVQRHGGVRARNRSVSRLHCSGSCWNHPGFAPAVVYYPGVKGKPPHLSEWPPRPFYRAQHSPSRRRGRRAAHPGRLGARRARSGARCAGGPGLGPEGRGRGWNCGLIRLCLNTLPLSSLATTLASSVSDTGHCPPLPNCATNARPLHPNALAFVPFGIV